MKKSVKQPTRLTLEDAVFGQIEFESMQDFGMWCHIPTNDTGHMITIVAPASGPTQLQRNFYTKLQPDLAALETEAKTFVSNQPNAPANLSRMTLYSVAVGEDVELSSGQFAIELSDENADEIHVVEFHNGKPAYYSVDD